MKKGENMELNGNKEHYYLSTATTKLKNTFEENGKYYITVEENIFYPQGGGQKGDRGVITVDNNEYNVVNTVKDPENITKVFLVTEKKVPETCIGKEVTCQINTNFRNKQTRLHTALHLFHLTLGEILGIEMPYPKISSIKDDGTAFNQYEFNSINEEIVKKAITLFFAKIKEGGKVETYPDLKKEGFRWWKYDKYKLPCGGTHVSDVSKIGEVEIKYSEKKGRQTTKIILK